MSSWIDYYKVDKPLATVYFSEIYEFCNIDNLSHINYQLLSKSFLRKLCNTHKDELFKKYRQEWYDSFKQFNLEYRLAFDKSNNSFYQSTNLLVFVKYQNNYVLAKFICE